MEYAEISLEYSEEPSQTSTMEHFVKIINSLKPLIIFIKSSILDVWLGSEYTSGYDFNKFLQ